MATTWERLQGAKPINRMASNVAKARGLDELPPEAAKLWTKGIRHELLLREQELDRAYVVEARLLEWIHELLPFALKGGYGRPKT